VEYLRILHLAASTHQAEVERVLDDLLAGGGLTSADGVKELVGEGLPQAAASVAAQMAPMAVDLAGYDSLLGKGEVAR
jgi:hypothetical protein